jgi:Fe2+ transport system protein FeoA
VVMGERTYEHRSLIDKLGVRPGTRVSVLGAGDQGLVAELRGRGADVSLRRRRESDLVFLGLARPGDLRRLASVEPSLRRDGAVWAVFPRGSRDLREAEVIRAGVESGLVDNKVVRFSDTHSALRFVIPRSRR